MQNCVYFKLFDPVGVGTLKKFGGEGELTSKNQQHELESELITIITLPLSFQLNFFVSKNIYNFEFKFLSKL